MFVIAYLTCYAMIITIMLWHSRNVYILYIVAYYASFYNLVPSNYTTALIKDCYILLVYYSADKCVIALSFDF